MKSKAPMQYTIRGISPSLDQALRKRAKHEGKSLNQTAVSLLEQCLGLTGEQIKHHDMDDLVGTWEDDPEFDSAIEAMDQIDPDLWR